MGIRNYLIEGVSVAGKTSVATALQRRGHHVVHGDRELAYLGDPATGEALEPPPPGNDPEGARWRHAHWIWDVDKLKVLVADQSRSQSFFCGGARNHHHFIDLFDEVFILDIDAATLGRRLAARPTGEFGGSPHERELIVRLHATRWGLPRNGVSIDATAPSQRVVDDILSKAEKPLRGSG